MVCEPLAGRRHVFVRERRTRLDFAAVIKTLCDELYLQAEKIVLVMDQLNTHGIASLLRSLPAAGGPASGQEARNPPHAQSTALG